MPTWLLFVAGSNTARDGNIRYFEYENDKFEYLSEYKSSDPQRGIAFLPKRGLDLHENEVMRAFKTVNDTYIEPISFIVPRRAEVFQEDIYPPVTGLKPAVSSKEWFDGEDGLPPKIDLADVYAGGKPTKIPSDHKPQAPLPSPIAPPAKEDSVAKQKSPEISKEKLQSPPINRGPPPSMKEQSASISAMASKYADKEPVYSSDESSFEEIPKHVEPPTAQQSKATNQNTSPVPTVPVVAVERALTYTSQEPIRLWQRPSASTNPSSASIPQTPTPTIGTGNIQEYLQEIKTLLQQQSQTMAAQTQKIAQLTSEVDTLTANLGNKSDNKDERIKQLENELAALKA